MVNTSLHSLAENVHPTLFIWKSDRPPLSSSQVSGHFSRSAQYDTAQTAAYILGLGCGYYSVLFSNTDQYIEMVLTKI